MGKFPHSSLKAHNIFPIHGLAVIVKRNFPMSSEAANLFSLFLLSHSWGKYNVPFVIHGEISFPHSRLRRSWGKIPSLFLLSMGLAHFQGYT